MFKAEGLSLAAPRFGRIGSGMGFTEREVQIGLARSLAECVRAGSVRTCKSRPV